MLQLSIAEGVHRLEDAYTNWYVIEDGDALTVVDTGHPRSWRSLEELVRLLGRSTRAVEAVVLTHAHFDHTASPSGPVASSASPSVRTSARCP